MKSGPSRESGTTGGGFNIHRNCLFTQFKFSPIFFPRFSNGHVDYVGVSEAAIWQPFYWYSPVPLGFIPTSPVYT